MYYQDFKKKFWVVVGGGLAICLVVALGFMRYNHQMGAGEKIAAPKVVKEITLDKPAQFQSYREVQDFVNLMNAQIKKGKLTIKNVKGDVMKAAAKELDKAMTVQEKAVVVSGKTYQQLIDKVK